MSKTVSWLWSLIVRLANWSAPFWQYISRRDVPLWLTILLAAGAAYGANVMLPKINHQHEYSKMKSAFVLQSLNDLNEQTSLLVALITEMNAEFASEDKVSIEAKVRAARAISELQWEATEMGMFIEEDASKLLDEYQVNLNRIRVCIGLSDEPFDKICADQATLDFLQSAEDVGKRLAEFS